MKDNKGLVNSKERRVIIIQPRAEAEQRHLLTLHKFRPRLTSLTMDPDTISELRRLKKRGIA